ncbi:hypothetical protein NDN01_00905 [Sphingomonas sp. QA11]|uniref:hypothetical protein n=1 Tax=Sphingomonas sp. QA11 TaxID=2950605 RepID=UPI00234A88A1|nr:hypothetical protein [Sphingomonas sp. QA11]WCM27527.1 hypothetical protein NDN01_00905 [Sphingomonas sp. QA11]
MTITIRSRLTLTAALAVMAVAGAAPATAENGAGQEKPKSTTQEAGQIVSQPVRDVGIEKTKIPPLLEEVSHDPYGTAGTGTCRQIGASIAALNKDLGPDYTSSPTKNKRNVAKAGGAAVVNSLIPFRGLVREVSGAAPAERRLNAAIDAGIARRGFLRGLQQARGCRG